MNCPICSELECTVPTYRRQESNPTSTPFFAKSVAGGETYTYTI